MALLQNSQIQPLNFLPCSLHACFSISPPLLHETQRRMPLPQIMERPGSQSLINSLLYSVRFSRACAKRVGQHRFLFGVWDFAPVAVSASPRLVFTPSQCSPMFLGVIMASPSPGFKGCDPLSISICSGARRGQTHGQGRR